MPTNLKIDRTTHTVFISSEFQNWLRAKLTAYAATLPFPARIDVPDEVWGSGKGNANFRLAFAAEVDLRVDASDRVPHRGSNKLYSRPVIQVGWGSCGSISIEQARTTLALYNRVTEVAAFLQMEMDGMNLLVTPDPKATEEFNAPIAKPEGK